MKILFIVLFLGLSLFYAPPDNYYSDRGVIMIDFDGYVGPRVLLYKDIVSPSSISIEKGDSVIAAMRTYFYPWDVSITTSDSVFYSYPISKRIRIVVTDDSIPVYYGFTTIGWSGGQSYYNALYLKDTTAGVVSSSTLQWAYIIGIAAAHEAGHILGLAHQSTWIGAYKLEEYDRGDSLYAPIMGTAYFSQQPIWTIGTNSFGQEQDDTAIISKTFKRIH